MPAETLITSLSRVPIFGRLTPEQIAGIAQRAEKIKFRSRDSITRTGEPGDGAYLLISGHAEDQAGLQLVLGSLIGELAMLVEHNYGATVMARDRVHCLKITRAAMHSQMLADPSLADLLSLHITEQMHKLADRLQHIDRALSSGGAQERPSAFVASRQMIGAFERGLRT